jgi:hypothetical protein
MADPLLQFGELYVEMAQFFAVAAVFADAPGWFFRLGDSGVMQGVTVVGRVIVLHGGLLAAML